MDLSKYTWGFKTNLAKGILAPKDAVALLIHLNKGELTRTQIVKHLQEWRPKTPWTIPGELPGYTYLFNASYRHVASDVHGMSCWPSWRGTPVPPNALWYRVKHNTYRLTLKGIERIRELGF